MALQGLFSCVRVIPTQKQPGGKTQGQGTAQKWGLQGTALRPLHCTVMA